MFDVYAETFGWQILNVAYRSLNQIVLSEILINCLRLRRRFNDYEVFSHNSLGLWFWSSVFANEPRSELEPGAKRLSVRRTLVCRVRQTQTLITPTTSVRTHDKLKFVGHQDQRSTISLQSTCPVALVSVHAFRATTAPPSNLTSPASTYQLKHR